MKEHNWESRCAPLDARHAAEMVCRWQELAKTIDRARRDVVTTLRGRSDQTVRLDVVAQLLSGARDLVDAEIEAVEKRGRQLAAREAANALWRELAVAVRVGEPRGGSE
jgi:hypothetical protein